jgi:mannose-1-phosphate guanylyltransferase
MNRPAVLILTAGLGTRLRPLTDVRAKAAVPVNGVPLACRVAGWLARLGFTDQVFNLHHHPETITSALGDGAGLGARIRYSWENPVLGSAGGPRHALPLLTDGGGERFLLVNGDTLTDVDPQAVLDRHHTSGAMVTMALIPNPAPGKYGGVTVDEMGYVSGFTRPGPAPSYHFVGVQAAEARAFVQIDDGMPFESVGRLYPELLRRDARAVAAYICDASFSDIGTPADCLRTSLALAEHEGDRLISPTAKIAPDAVVERTALWDHVIVERGATLRECIVADGSRIPEGLSVTRCAIIPAGLRKPEPDEWIEQGLLLRPLDSRKAP